MKKFGLFTVMIVVFQWLSAQNLKPYILAFETTESISVTNSKIKANLEKNSLKVVGEYQPANDNNRFIIVFTSKALINSVKNAGGLTGFAATLRIGIIRENGKTIVSYTNPEYWGNAYFREYYPNVVSTYSSIERSLKETMKSSGNFIGKEFGSEDGLTTKELRKYHYMFGMPYFDDTEELEEFDSHQEAIDKIDANLKKGVPNVKLVYKIEIPDNNLVLYGLALSGENGEAKFLPIIDKGDPKHTAFLPYELLIIDNEVHMLHGRFRIALSFPDLTMGTFSKIMSTPGDIEDLLEQLVE